MKHLHMSPFPTLIIGGPPHAGKSVLTASLTQALRVRDVAHLVLLAASMEEAIGPMNCRPTWSP